WASRGRWMKPFSIAPVWACRRITLSPPGFISSLSFLFCHPNAEPAELVLINELDSGLFKCRLNSDQSCNVARENPFLAFNTPNGCNANFSRPGNFLLAPAEKRPGCTELCHLKHPPGRIIRFTALDKHSRVLSFISYLISVQWSMRC